MVFPGICRILNRNTNEFLPDTLLQGGEPVNPGLQAILDKKADNKMPILLGSDNPL
jgi:hypothetical protein